MKTPTKLQPGRELDRVIATKVLNLVSPEEQLPHFSTEISDAFQLVEHVCRDKGCGREHFSLFMFTTHWKAMFGAPNLLSGEGYDQIANLPSAATPAMAICLAALDSVEMRRS